VRLPEIRESEAPPQIAALYDDIRTVMGVPFVNLIHRYLATIPGALESAWEIGRPAFVEGRLDRWAEEIAARAELDSLASEAFSSKLGKESRERCAALVDVYNRQNPRNVIVFTAFRALLEGDGEPFDGPPSRLPPPAHPPPRAEIAPLPRVDDLDPQTRTLLEDLRREQGLSETVVVPSLYLHLATVPGGVEAAHAALEAPLRSGRVGTAAARVVAFVPHYAKALLEAPPHRLPRGVYERRTEIAANVGDFTERGIPSMVVAGRILARAFSR